MYQFVDVQSRAARSTKPDSRYAAIFQAGERSAERGDHCPCAVTLIVDCGFDAYEAKVLVKGFKSAARRLGLPINMACDHASFADCLAAANAEAR